MGGYMFSLSLSLEQMRVHWWDQVKCHTKCRCELLKMTVRHEHVESGVETNIDLTFSNSCTRQKNRRQL